MSCEDYPILMAFMLSSLVTPIALMALKHGGFLFLSAALSFVLALYTIEHSCGWMTSLTATISLFSVLISSVVFLGVSQKRLELENMIYAIATPVITIISAGAMVGKGLIPLGYGTAVVAGVVASMVIFVAMSLVKGASRKVYYIIKG